MVWVLMVASQLEGAGGRKYEYGDNSPLKLCKIDMLNVSGAGRGRCLLDLGGRQYVSSLKPAFYQCLFGHTVSQCAVSTTDRSGTLMVALQLRPPRSRSPVGSIITRLTS